MIVPPIAEISATHIFSILSTSKAASMGGGTVSNLFSQWSNPSDISTILMIIGGDVVQKALAQGTGVWYFTPVCFSFGCVSYAFTALVSIIGNGRLLPEPDYPVKVFNLESGYVRENKNWVVGRILRDLETSLSEEEPLADDAIRISVYEAAVNRNGLTQFSLSHMHLWGLACVLLQLGLAAIPIALAREWDIMLITAAGTLLVQMAGALPQWRAEKLPNRQKKSSTYALTQGNGSREIVVIFGNHNCLDLEELSASGSPRGGRPWEKFTWHDLFSKARRDKEGRAAIPRSDTQLRKARVGHGLPLGFWLTRVSVVSQSVLWLLLLVNVASSRSYNWVLLAIGALGMFQNGYLAGMIRPSHLRNLPLTRVEVIRAKKVMDGLMDLEVQYECAEPLRDEFFPGKLREAEYEWWAGNRDPYDEERAQAEWRGIPRSYQRRISTLSGASPKYNQQPHVPTRVEEHRRYSYQVQTSHMANVGFDRPDTGMWPQEKKPEHGTPVAEYELLPDPKRLVTPVSSADSRLVEWKNEKASSSTPDREVKRIYGDHERDSEKKWRDDITKLPPDDM